MITMPHFHEPRFLFRLFSAALAFCLFAGSGAAAPDVAEKIETKKHWPAHLRMLSGPPGGEWHMMGESIAAILSSKLMPTSNRAGGGRSNIDGVDSKNGDIAFTISCFLTPEQENGGAPQQPIAQNVVLLNSLYPQVLYFILREEFADAHRITSVESLLQQKIPLRFASLKAGTASEFILDTLFRYGYNTSFDQLRNQGWTLTFSNYPETADSFVAGDIDCFAYTAGVTVPLILTMEQHTPLVVLPVEQKALNIMEQKLKTQTYTIQPGIYKSVTAPLRTLSSFSCMIVRKDLPEDLVFTLSKILWQERDPIAKAFTDFQRISPETALPEGLEAHPGAVRFWKTLRAKDPQSR